MNAPSHDVAATVVVVGIVTCVIRIIVVIVVVAGPIKSESAGKESSPMVEAVVKPAAMEAAAVLETVACKAAALKSCCTNRA